MPIITLGSMKVSGFVICNDTQTIAPGQNLNPSSHLAKFFIFQNFK
jgi:hypothetical protein